MGKLDGKVAVITGGAGGIGLATGKLFAREGAKVLLVDLDPKALETAVREAESPNVKACAADVSKPVEVQKYFSQAVKDFGGVDIIFANAGIEGKTGSLVDTSEVTFQKVLDVNVKGAWLAVKYGAPEIAKRGGGSIMITSSIAGLMGSVGLGPYVTSKHAVIGIARTAALELAPLNIRVNTIHPGPIENRMMRSIEKQLAPDAPQAVKAGFEQQVPLRRYGRNEEIANMALFLASSDSSYSTGAQFVADGGFVV